MGTNDYKRQYLAQILQFDLFFEQFLGRSIPVWVGPWISFQKGFVGGAGIAECEEGEKIFSSNWKCGRDRNWGVLEVLPNPN